MSLPRTILAWIGLILLLVIEMVAAYLPGMRAVVPFIGLGMAVLIAMAFMGLGGSRGLVPVFAAAGVFWICVLMGLGSLDPLTRHDIRADTARWSSTSEPRR